MLQDVNHMEANCLFYVKVDTFDRLEHSKICILTITSKGIVMLTVYHDYMVSIWFM